jgi:DNA-binding SARP family transcriptional activator
MFRARAAKPIPEDFHITQPSLRQIADAPLSLVVAEPAFIVDGNVASVLHEYGRWKHTAWIRTVSLDAHPDHLIRSLEHGVAEATGHTIRVLSDATGHSGSLAPESYWSIGRELARHVATDGTLVVENLCAMADLTALTDVLRGWVTSAPERRGILVCYGSVPRRARRDADLVVDTGQLAITSQAARDLVGDQAGALSEVATARLVRLVRGRAAMLHAVVEGVASGPALAVVEDAVRSSWSARVLLARLARRLLRTSAPDDHEAITVALGIGHWHASLGNRNSERAVSPWPWFSQLEGGWLRLRPVWEKLLHRHLKNAASGRVLYVPSADRGSARRSVHNLKAISEAAVAENMPNDGHRAQVTGPADAPVEVEGDVLDDTSPAGNVDDTSFADNAETPASAPTLVVRMLGTFKVMINGRPIAEWDSPLGLTLFKYLLVHRDRPTTRDALIDTFWPDAPTKRAANRFHVTLSALRRTIRAVDDADVVVFRGGVYMINPELDLLVDVDEFTSLVDGGHRADRAGDRETALSCFARAIALYRGDLLTDNPYDDWAMLLRETFRVTYLDVLDRLSALYLENEDLGPCIAIAQRILEQDPCREDAHRLIMRCHSRQGRYSEARRQFELCTRMLASNWGAQPSRATLELHQSLQRVDSPER